MPESQPPSQTRTTQSNDPMQQWFAAAPSPQNQQPPHRRRFVIIIVAGIMMAITATIIILSLILPHPPACLTAADYKALTGVEYGANFESRDVFVGYSIPFLAATADYDTAAEQSGTEIIRSLGRFRAERKSSSIIFTIESIYSADTGRSVAEQRSARIKADLMGAGISEDSIRVIEPAQTDAEDVENEPATAKLTLTSDPGCYLKQ